MDNLKQVISVETKISVKEVSDLFCSMDGAEQAEFFNNIGESVKNWGSPFVFQLQSIVETKKLTVSGKQIMFELGEYAYAPTWREKKESDQFREEI